MENSPYMDSITGKQAVDKFHEDEQASLEGRQLISMESNDNVDDSIFIYVNSHFPAFLRYVRLLSPHDQEMLLSYHCLRKTQNQLAIIFKSTQTVCSFQLRATTKALVAMMSWDSAHPT